MYLNYSENVEKMKIALFFLFSLVYCSFSCEEVYLKEQEVCLLDAVRGKCAKEGGPCITDWMGVCGEWKKEKFEDVR